MNFSLNYHLEKSLIKIITITFLALGSISCQASRLQEIGESSSATLDKSYIDLDSISQEGNFRIATFLTVYDKARVNSKGLKFDRHTQSTAFDCQRKQFALISTVGYLDGKQIATSTPNPDWKNSFKDMPSTPFSQRTYTLVCGGAMAGSSQPNIGNSTPPGMAQKPKVSSGTGIAITKKGYILTNNHVVNACKTIMVQGVDAQQSAATVEVVDPKNDLALLKTSMMFSQVAKFRSQSKPVKLGEEIGVVGFPLPGILSSEPKATFGQINSVAGMQNDYSLFQFSAPIQGGNSGGPVLDSTGAVVGVVVSQASMLVAALTGNVPQNVNFAIRGELAQIFMNSHGIKYSVAGSSDKLETDEIAERGRQVSVWILCSHE